MQHKIELTSKLVLALIAIVVVFSVMTVVPMTASALTIPNGFITSGMIRDGQVKTQDLANDAVTSPKIADGTIQEQDIADGVIPDGGGGALPNIHIVTGQAELPGGGGASAMANCPDGEVLTGGGFVALPDIKISSSFPLDENTWDVHAESDFASTTTLTAYAICMGPSA